MMTREQARRENDASLVVTKSTTHTGRFSIKCYPPSPVEGGRHLKAKHTGRFSIKC